MGFMEGGVVRVFQLSFDEAFVIVHRAIADELNLGLPRDSFEVGVQYRLLCALGFVVTVAIRLIFMSVFRVPD